MRLEWPEGNGLAYRIVIVQLAAALAAVVVLSLVALEQAAAALLGSLVCIVPTACFAVCATQWRKPGPIVLAGLLKPMTIVGLMVAAFVLAKPPPLGFFAGLVVVHLAYLVAPLLDEHRGRGRGRKAKALESLNSGSGIR